MTRTDLTDAELADIARDAALRVPGLGTVEAVRVTTGQDSEDRPTHVFSLLIECNRDPQPRPSACSTAPTGTGTRVPDSADLLAVA